MSRIIMAAFILFSPFILSAQNNNDTVVNIGGRLITLSEVVVNNKINVPAFIDRVRTDTTFYKAFRTLHIIGFTALNDIRMVYKDGDIKASLRSKIRQLRNNNCRSMEVLEETTTGDIYDKNKNFNYYTGEMYAGLFFTQGTICGEDNIVKGKELSTAGLSGMEKHKAQLKMLFFNPGKQINGLPFISGKTAIFDKDMADRYDMSIDMEEHNKTSCYVFTLKGKENRKGDVVIDEMTTWFNDKTFEIVARNYSLSYDAGVYDFNVQMQVELTKFGDYLVPSLIRYIGNWKAIFKKRERGIFTATLFDFVK
ncbi:MAG TPA: hypothetical protein VMY77_13000 [Chitinophagaceae bacterium]|nr:hypothetical protein [Chitinophagaceae bacterium]